MTEYEISILLNTIEQMASDAEDKGERDFGLRLTVKDAFTICRLVNENAKLKAERDAAVADLKRYCGCSTCVHFNPNNFTCDAFEECTLGVNNKWEWRGVQNDG